MNDMDSSAPVSLLNLRYFTGFPQPIVFQSPNRKEGKSRRSKSAKGDGYIKHRRTRSGCFTCRSRRVKCDEAHPTCERCRKGNRTCVYPEPAPAGDAEPSARKKTTRSTSKRWEPRVTLSSVEEEEFETRSRTTVTSDEEAPVEQSRRSARSRSGIHVRTHRSSPSRDRDDFGTASESPSHGSDKPWSTSGDSVTDVSPSPLSREPMPHVPLEDSHHWATLEKDVQFYLKYHNQHITYLNYNMLSDPDDFFASTLPQVAIVPGNEALLYAVVAFTAYHYALEDPRGNFEEFLQFYNKSVTEFLKAFGRSEFFTLATLLTVLQLSVIEANFSDFSQMKSHHRAAGELIVHLINPDMIYSDLSVRAALLWYIRFDNSMLFWCGGQPLIPADCLLHLATFCQQRQRSHPDEMNWRVESSHLQLCLIARDIADYRSGWEAQFLSEPEFHSRHEMISCKLKEWRQNLDPVLTAGEYLVSNQYPTLDIGADDIFESWGRRMESFTKPLFSTTLMLAQWHFITLMHECPYHFNEHKQHISPRLVELAVRICQIWETIERLPCAKKGCFASLIRPLRLALLFLPQEEPFQEWIKRRLAMTEAQGVMMNRPCRVYMAKLLNDPPCVHWWLPNGEGETTVVHNARTIADERWASNPPIRQDEHYSALADICSTILAFNNSNTPDFDME